MRPVWESDLTYKNNMSSEVNITYEQSSIKLCHKPCKMTQQKQPKWRMKNCNYVKTVKTARFWKVILIDF